MQDESAQSILARFTCALLDAHATVVIAPHTCGLIEGEPPGFQL